MKLNTDASAPFSAKAASLRLPAAEIFWFLIFLCLVFFLSMKVPLESDFFQHLTHGEEFLRNPAAAMHDHWSFTAEGERWVRWTFGYGILLASLHRYLGIPGIWLAQCCFLIALASLLWYFLKRSKIRPSEKALILAAIFCELHYRFSFRAESLAYIFFILIWYKLQQASESNWVRYLLLPGSLVIWQFYQNSAYLGFILLGIHVCLRVWFERSIRPIGYLAFVAGILSVAHPDGYLLHYRFWQGYEFHRYFAVSELQSSFRVDHAYFLAVLGLAITGIIASKRRPEKWMLACWFRLLSFVFFSLLSLFVERAIPFAIFCSLPFLIRGYRMVLVKFGRLRRLMFFVGVLTLGFVFLRVSYAEYSPGLKLNPRYHPQTVADFILTAKPPGRVLNPVYPAGYFLWRFQGEPRLFMDFRLDLFIPAIRDYAEAMRSTDKFRRFLEKYKITYVILETRFHNPYSDPIFALWPVVYQDDAYLIRMDSACRDCEGFMRRYAKSTAKPLATDGVK